MRHTTLKLKKTSQTHKIQRHNSQKSRQKWEFKLTGFSAKINKDKTKATEMKHNSKDMWLLWIILCPKCILHILNKKLF